MLSQTLNTEQAQRLEQTDGYKKYVKSALLAFKLVLVNGLPHYTCNVKRLRDCDRLGDDAEVTMWRTHFFLRSRHFDSVHGVIFSNRPGKVLADFSAEVVESRFIMTTSREILDVSNGERIALEEDLEFNSDEDVDEG